MGTRLQFGLPLPDATRSSVVWGQLYGAARSLAVVEAAERHAGWVCVLVESAADADRLEAELRFFDCARPIRRLTDYETLPYDHFAPAQDLIAERLAVLHDLYHAPQPQVLIVASAALLLRVPPVEFVAGHSIELGCGQRMSLQAMRERLVQHGYLHVEQVVQPGEFALRGALLDVFPSGARQPVRIDFFDDEIEGLRLFDPETQLTTQKLATVRVVPAREFPFDAASIRAFRQRFRQQFAGDPGRCQIYRSISEAVLPPGIEYYLPLFFERTCSLFDYLPEHSLIVETEGLDEAVAAGWQLIQDRFEQLCGDLEQPILPPELGFLPPAELAASRATRPRLLLRTHEQPASAREAPYNAGSAHPLGGSAALESDGIEHRLADSDPSLRTLLVASSAGRREMLVELLEARGRAPLRVEGWQPFLDSRAPLCVTSGELGDGLRLPRNRIQVITAEQLGLERPSQRSKRRRVGRSAEAIIRELTDLRIGAPVVHEEYGVGRYQGLKLLEIDGLATEFLMLEYAGGDKLYVPVQNLHLVTRYSGAAPEQAPLHRLGSDQWETARRKAAKQAHDAAAELLGLYARRAAQRTRPVVVTDDSYQRFALEFPFEETEDQLEAIAAVLRDMAGEQPMDRVICGDVGFGKTEVALRAAFVAAQAGHQVAVLVPTTLLAQQHYRSFADRFADWPVKVEMLSRFRGTKASQALLEGLANGTVDIVIGTHKLLQDGIRLKRLGLLIIDEEHRFGVKHKERLKRLQTGVHLLTLTATPIPRTLNMTLGGLRDLSIIATPPVDRLAVKTFVGEWSPQQVREAILREIRRGGQTYVVHNRVEDIERFARQLAALVPEAAVRVAHGQMPERTLESVMLDFYHRRFNVLVCSTIIESGIDVPTANTIIIDRADHLGLAQLHQLRGRVGRSHHQAYAYLIAPARRALSADAIKRLEAIEALEELGSGFTLATHDLEIRGAGELLGEGQSGQIHEVGFALYNELLSKAVADIRAGRTPSAFDPFHHGTEIELGLPTLLPAEYMPDVHTRLVHYKRIANARSASELDELRIELIDRFGLLPEPTRNLFAVTWLKLLAQSLGIHKIQADADGAVVSFAADTRLEPARLIELVHAQPDRFRLAGPTKLKVSWHTGPDTLPDLIESALRALGADTARSEAA